MNENKPCPIWGTPNNSSELYRGDGFYVDSPRAGGKYFVDGRAELLVGNLDVREKARLTTWMIEQRKLGVERPEVWSYENEIKSKTRRTDMTVHARADELLKYIHKVTPHIGKKYVFRTGESHDGMEMLAYTESVNDEELQFLLVYLIEQGWLELERESMRSKHVTITVEGYARITDMENIVKESSRAFVAMWFDDSLNDAWDAVIKPAIEDSGYEAIRIDKQEHLNKIDDQIIAEIRRSRFIVADFTHGDGGARGGVYYEAGFAHGLNIPVIFTCREDTIEYVHFDTRQYNHILWDNTIVLKERLENRISAVIGDGPLKRESQRK